jgi:hypothetical protein
MQLIYINKKPLLEAIFWSILIQLTGLFNFVVFVADIPTSQGTTKFSVK